MCDSYSGCVASLNMLEYERKPNDQGVNIVKSTEPMGIFYYKYELFLTNIGVFEKEIFFYNHIVNIHLFCHYPPLSHSCDKQEYHTQTFMLHVRWHKFQTYCEALSGDWKRMTCRKPCVQVNQTGINQTTLGKLFI
jgi:hypothetical protein